MSDDAIDLNGQLPTEPSANEYQEVPEIPATEADNANLAADPTRLASLVEAEDGIAPAFGQTTGYSGVGATMEEAVEPTVSYEADVEEDPSGVNVESTNPVAPEDKVLHKRSRLLHLLLSLVIVLLVVGGAAAAAYWYSKSDSTFIKLPKLPFVSEPEAEVEKVVEAEPLVPEEPAVTPPKETPVLDTKLDGPFDERVEDEQTKGGVEVTPKQEEVVVPPPAGKAVEGWKKYLSQSWGYSFFYPPEWYLYPRDSGLLGESTMVASSPLASLDNNIGAHTVRSGNILVAVGVLTEDYSAEQSLLDYIKNNASLYGFSSSVIKKIDGRSFVRSVAVGGVTHYHINSGRRIYFVSIKPEELSPTLEETVEKLLTSVSFNQ